MSANPFQATITRPTAILMLLAAAFFWGAGNVANKTVLTHIDAYTAVSLRCALAALVILPFLRTETRVVRAPGWLGSAATVGLLFAISLIFQQTAYRWTSVTNASFLVNICTVLTPLLAWAILNERQPIRVIVAAGITLGGAALMSGVDPATARLHARFGSARVINTLLDEQAILGLAIGAAHNGLLPLPEVQFLAYVHNAEDQIRGEVKTLPIRSRLMDNVKGKMFRRPLFEYVAPNLYAEIYDPPPGADPEKIAAWARQKYKEGVEFDSYFDSHDHTRLFCTEMAALAIEHAGGPPTPVEDSNPNPSVVAGMKWLGVPPGEALPVYRFASPDRYVGAMGQFISRTQAWSYFEGKHEIHRRFANDQRMGFVFSLDDYGRIGVRKEISDLVARCAHMYDVDPHPPGPGDPRIEADCRKIADEMFGPFPLPALAAMPAPLVQRP
jgi:uncharacterized membrane protein